MSKKQETISDIVADIRAQNQGLPEDDYARSPLVCDLLRIADRIEAAAKSIEADRDNWRRQALDEDARANAATIKDSLTVGNAAEMREALYAITRIDTRRLKRLLCELVEADIFDGGQISKTISAVEKARQALSAPPRNCDIGSAEEQAIRHKRFCDGKGMKYCWGRGCFKCFAAWEQIPYEKEAK